jgi:hypothetical protein
MVSLQINTGLCSSLDESWGSGHCQHKRLEKSWPEKGEREVQWFSPTAAAETVSEPVLSDIIRNLPKRL